MPDKVTSIEEALAPLADGSELGVGGILTTRKPVALLDAIGRDGRRGLRLWTLLGSLDVEILAAHRALAEVNAIYVGFEQLGPAPAYEGAVSRGDVVPRDFSEMVLVAGLRASLAGLPFLPTRGARGSEIVAGLGLREVACPYTGERLLAAPAIRPDVTILHAEAAARDGTVLGPGARDFLFDFDANVARAARRVVVSVERIAGSDEMAARSGDILLFGHEVDAIVVEPGGARPSALPGVHPSDLGRIGAYLDAARAGAVDGVLDVLVGR